ncbi:type III PLP-dependent enzyme domain-containing protein [Alkalihalophilus marmarensis]|uniref:type III PLP-dependent enzyme n=1 Tax=Alkalihalophilus marmarensis TaxID=521377 RepID=UPI002DBD5018|nr:type III PLP-dependent enzyme [Alkalihalophilus marmarensis]MEC2074264.1 type III PLP-dependent enzyme [Alkalihalophilus marmarensis]
MEYSILRSIAKKYETPLYIYDGNALIKNFKKMKNLLNEDTDIYLSLKANPSLGVSSIFSNIGAGAEVASLGELKTALKAGFDNDRIIFSGPGKKKDELEYAIKKKIYCIIAESLEEIQLISEFSYKFNIKVNIGLRINPSFKNNTYTTLKMGGVPSQFGIEEHLINRCIGKILENTNMKFKGIHTYNGTQVLNYEEVIDAMRHTFHLVELIKNKFDLHCEFVDLGGGFGVKYFNNQKDFNFERFSIEFNKLVSEQKDSNPSTRYILESGRFLLAPYGYYITKVNYIKESKGKKFVIVDGGLNHHQASTFRGRFMRNNFPIDNLNGNQRNELEKVSVVGPLCTPEDCIGNDVILPKIDVGDYIVIKNSGAYGLTYSPIFFLSHESPYEVMYLGEHDYIIRDKIDYDRMIDEQHCITSKELR